ncbi:hypothetical protein PMI42_03511 [Bradyrhizobium sp. YR681]|uniref:hypothetical protein n=1 Tax=Bradyrhizobium sp. YR681 TaxID=1144344 RepID=UPI000270F632|nr:hypothetical protein [Bradyrhizobium sp. YR681]EJN13120.1 hypothetical protein PMI42_03511 [Bradyrhizobium sp. YR681]
MSVRFTIIYASLFFVLLILVAFLTGPLWGLRLDYEKGQQMQLIQLCLPVFLSYLAAAVSYATVGKTLPEPTGERGKILRLVTLGGFTIFLVGVTVSTLMYFATANGWLKNGGLDFEKYSLTLTLLLGFLGSTTSTVSTFIFSAKQ